MGSWYRDNQRLFREQKDLVSSSHPTLHLDVLSQGSRINHYVSLNREAAVVHGKYLLNVPETSRSYDYGIALVISNDYFKPPPAVYCDDPKLPPNIDRHIMENGRACLGVNADIAQRWRDSPDIVSFLDNIIGPFLAWQVYYDAYGSPPPWNQRSHGKEGIVEFYAELLGVPISSNIENFMSLLARKNEAKGHEICPCGSGAKLRNCHGTTLKTARQKLSREDVAADLSLLNFDDVPAMLRRLRFQQ